MAADLFHRSASNESPFTQTAARSRGGNWREAPPANHSALADIEPAFAEPCFEPVETRLLLSVEAGDFARTQDLHPDVNLSADLTACNIINITADPLTIDTALHNTLVDPGIVDPGATSNLIVVQATDESNTMDIGTNELEDEAVMLETPVSASALVPSFGWHSITVTWTAVTAADGYTITWYAGATRIGSMEVTGGDMTSATITGLQPSTAYTFRVYSTMGEDVSTGYAGASATTKADPVPSLSVKAPPRSVKAKGDGLHSILLTWKAPKPKQVPAGYQVAGYNVYEASGQCIATVSAGQNVLSFRVEGLWRGATYRFRVAVVYRHTSSGDLLESYKSVTKKAKTKTTVKLTKPKLAKTLASDKGSASVTLRWKAQPNAERFNVACFLGKRTIPVTLDWIYENNDPENGKIIGVTIRGLSPNAKYKITVQAANDTWNVHSATAKKAIRTVAIPAKLARPKFTTVRGFTSITLRWEAQPDAERFEMECFLGTRNITDTVNQDWIEANGKIIGVTIRGLSPGTAYKFTVQAISDTWNIQSTAAGTVKTVTFPATKTPKLEKSSLMPTSATLTWNATKLPTGVTEGSVTYEVYYSETRLTTGSAGWSLVSRDEGEDDGIWATFTGGPAVTINGLSPGTTYYMYIRSIWIDGTGVQHTDTVYSNSSRVTVKTPR